MVVHVGTRTGQKFGFASDDNETYCHIYELHFMTISSNIARLEEIPLVVAESIYMFFGFKLCLLGENKSTFFFKCSLKQFDKSLAHWSRHTSYLCWQPKLQLVFQIIHSN